MSKAAVAPPRVIQSFFAAALAHHRSGRLDLAKQFYLRCLREVPRHPDALHLLGLVALDQGEVERAIGLIGEALKIVPPFAEGHANLGNALRAAGRPDEAAASYRYAINLCPDFVPAHYNLGLLQSAQGQFEAALQSYRRVAALAPANADCQIRLGDVLLLLRRHDDAAEHYRRAAELDPNSVAAHRGLAASLRAMGDVEGALASYRDARALGPANGALSNEIGRCHLALGQLREAFSAFRQAVNEDDGLADAYRNLAKCRLLQPDTPEMEKLLSLVGCETLPPEDRATALFAAGKALDDAGRYDEAFAFYEKGNTLYRSERARLGDRFDGLSLARHVDRLIDIFDAGFFARVAGWGAASDLPVFILGMPRSGTSLVEQILASHTLCFGAGERHDLGTIAAGLGVEENAWSSDSVRQAADRHIARLQRMGGAAKRVTDKLPDNIFMLGAIACLFPQARVILCRRDPRDTALSCYFEKFSAGHLTFSYDLSHCVQRLEETGRLAAHWRRVLPIRFIEIDYEALVADLEGQTRRLLQFLDLDFERGCLNFDASRRSVRTASSWQVRQPLYASSVGRWRHYSRQLHPFFE